MAKKKRNVQIDTGSALTIENVSRIKKDYDAAIGKSSEVDLFSKKLDAIDLTGVQLLQYIQNQAETNNKKVNFRLKLDGDQQDMIKKNGFQQILELINE